ncbi:N-acetylmuramoyl-L-alanine amidase [Pseudobutyrivibrio sp. 49]|uniref:N-acetylmuramoyl-L-alanine amidase family protein n=1 Tax=Pseudobutyrivibrio sp. 49 TaxID=1855344 RepID=UPI0008901230|nr:N-acetylmuramoyl-L-alanine amidase [Pseudobutyrivibrio sp. 49]SDH97807.1 N-acetylmuramoyl-L-alanine amidase [Pseudobutyrivibrio sp. 49]
MKRKTKRIICIALIYTLFCLIAVLMKNFVDFRTEAEPLADIAEETTEEDTQTPTEPVIKVVTPGTGHVVCIDAGQQQTPDMKKEPIGPEATKKKPKMDDGPVGKYTGITEYQLNLDIALKVQKELENRGYTVVMTRTTNDVNISNSERSNIANEAKAEAFIRIHADGSDDSTVHGASAVCQTTDNPYNGNLYESSRKLADCVLDGMVTSTGCEKRQVIEVDSMPVINWSQVPVSIIEVGYISNKDEEIKLATESYQQLVAKGIADGLDNYFN